MTRGAFDLINDNILLVNNGDHDAQALWLQRSRLAIFHELSTRSWLSAQRGSRRLWKMKIQDRTWIRHRDSAGSHSSTSSTHMTFLASESLCYALMAATVSSLDAHTFIWIPAQTPENCVGDVDEVFMGLSCRCRRSSGRFTYTSRYNERAVTGGGESTERHATTSVPRPEISSPLATLGRCLFDLSTFRFDGHRSVACLPKLAAVMRRCHPRTPCTYYIICVYVPPSQLSRSEIKLFGACRSSSQHTTGNGAIDSDQGWSVNATTIRANRFSWILRDHPSSFFLTAILRCPALSFSPIHPAIDPTHLSAFSNHFAFDTPMLLPVNDPPPLSPITSSFTYRAAYMIHLPAFLTCLHTTCTLLPPSATYVPHIPHASQSQSPSPVCTIRLLLSRCGTQSMYIPSLDTIHFDTIPHYHLSRPTSPHPPPSFELFDPRLGRPAPAHLVRSAAPPTPHLRPSRRLAS
ncbi:hypothetical protein R3P38DRAFT_3296823 [Favolaschia claudopus]|uniref:Uncharacterized protein n=1 Tax=Favolaschia claudopus TaxID=2862362 RepID=A0AAV9Z7D2_9AGAR